MSMQEIFGEIFLAIAQEAHSISRTFYCDSLCSQRFQTLITLLFESSWVSNLIGGLSKGRGSLLVNFSSLRQETTKLNPHWLW